MARTTGPSCWTMTVLLATILQFVSIIAAQQTVLIEGTDRHNVSRNLTVDRYPSLYTGDFADCLNGESLFNITKYDAGYYADNMTVVFHLDGTTNVRQENLMLHLSLFAFGETIFDATLDPCKLEISSLCPLNANNPVEAWTAIEVTVSEIDIIPSISLDIPDFEGSARLQVFANSSQTEIGCFQAVLSNGNTLSHPYAISPALGGLTALAILSSFAAAVYGVSIPHMRTHYAHSFSVLVVLETFQTIYFSGALSVHWPSLLPAWWSNFAWSAGLIYSHELVESLRGFAGISGNASQVGGAGSNVINNEGGLIHQIYGRSLDLGPAAASQPSRRALAYNASDPYDYTWGGRPVAPGMPIPGTWPGFRGTLAAIRIPIAGAFTVGLIWWLVALALVVISVTAAKFCLDLLIRLKLVNKDGFAYFRTHLPGYLATSVLRTLLVASFPLLTLALFQMNLERPTGPLAIAAVVFALLLVGLGGLVAYACYFRLRFSKFQMGTDTIILEQGRLFKVLPFVAATRASTIGEKESATKRYGSLPFLRIHFVDNDPDRPRPSVHKDEAYVKRFGWLAAHYRRKRWWFFALWFAYQVARACFLGGASRSPLAQVYGLFILEVLAFIVFVNLKPYEGQRNAVVAVWMLGMSKVVTAGLSIAFLPDFNNSRILLTVFGLIIVVVQGFMVLAVIVLVVLGMISSWMSLHRNRETFRPQALDSIRISYYEHLQNKAPDMRPPPREEANGAAEPRSTFTVNSVRRAPKIEDDDDPETDVFPSLSNNNVPIQDVPPATRPRSRTNSVNSRYSVGSLPRRARTQRASWSSRDFAEWDAQFERPDSAMGVGTAGTAGTVGTSMRTTTAQGRQRSSSLRQIAHLNSHSSLRMQQQPDIRERPETPSAQRRPMSPPREVSEDKLEPFPALEIVPSRRDDETTGREMEDNGVSPVKETDGKQSGMPQPGEKEEEQVAVSGTANESTKDETADVTRGAAPTDGESKQQPTSEKEAEAEKTP
ncbi:TRP-domain-containing protein [Sodiomyces alkalinus F11]|uniref:TRP-domain-containing protein n=1 Tax=Sodiomyces alkalinus (strain CBS 110278 / VKM F-3762 / F11) TaxID=1314773 RepID=A0A3N2Q4K5_SODAK|nr:TRP-domain-containing protein [Sodiomyces alkalinus F11]ROT41713.1 TRP-domain-containing protein [Sodiomyces alkalinus F11]